MGLDIGTLTGRIELQDGMTSALMQIKTKLDRTGDALAQFGMTFASTALKIGAGAAAIGASVVGISAGILALADKGSVLNGVVEEFDRLAKAAGTTSEALIGPLNKALRGTVDEIELMKMANKSLGAGVRLTAADLATMGETARAMARATGTDAAGALETLNSAMLTGNMRALKRLGITIDVTAAERKFAASIGTTRDELSAAGQLEAKRIAMLEAMRKRVDEMGIAEMSMGERIKAAQVAVAGWFDTLAMRVAKSKDVENAFIRIQEALERAFGTGPQKLLDLIVKAIDWFARAVGNLAPYIETAANAVKSFWDWLVDLNERFNITGAIVIAAKAAWSFLEGAFYLVRNAVRAVIAAWESMPDWLQRITTGALKLGAGVALTGVAISALTAPLSAMISKIDTGINIFGNFAGALYSITNMTWLWQAPIAASTKLWAILMNQIAIYRATLPMLAAQVVLWTIAENAAAAAQMWFTTVITGTNMALTTMAERLGLVAAANYVMAVSTRIAAAASTALAVAVNFFNGSSLVMGARVALGGMAIRATGVASLFAAGAVTTLGIVMQGLLWVLIPIGIALAAWSFGKWLGSFSAVQSSMIWLAEWLHKITFGFIGFSEAEAEARRKLLGLKETVDITAATAANGFEKVTPSMLEFQARMEAVGRAAGKSGVELEQFVRDAIAQVNELKDAGAVSVAVLTAKLEQIGILAPDVALRKLADEARTLQANGATLTPQLQELVDRFGDVGAAAAGAGDNIKFLKDHTDELNAAMKQMSGETAIKETQKLTSAYAGLVKSGINPTLDALTSYRDSLRATVEIYANRPPVKFQGVTISGSNISDDLENNLKEVNAQVEKLQYKKNWESSISDGLRAIGKESGEARMRIRDLGESLTNAGVTSKALDMVAAVSKIGGASMVAKDQVESAFNVIVAEIERATLAGEQVPGALLKAAEDLYTRLEAIDSKYLQTLTANRNRVADIGRKGTDLELVQIQRARDAEIKALGIRTDATAKWIDDNTKLIDEYYEHQRKLALGTSDTIVERMAAAGIKTRAEMEKTALATTRDFAQMTRSGEYSSRQLREQAARVRDAWETSGTSLKKVVERFEALSKLGGPMAGIFHSIAVALGEIQKAADATPLEELSDVLTSLGDVFQNINSRIGQTLQTIGGAMKGIAAAGEDMGKKLVIGFTAAAAVIQQYAAGTVVAAVATGALGGAAAAASLLMMFPTLGPYSVAIYGVGVAIGALTGWWQQHSAAAKQAVTDTAAASAALAELNKSFMELVGTTDDMKRLAAVVGSIPTGREIFVGTWPVGKWVPEMITVQDALDKIAASSMSAAQKLEATKKVYEGFQNAVNEMLKSVTTGSKLASKELLAFMEVAITTTGELSKQAKDFRLAWLGSAAGGLSQMFAGLQTGATALAQKAATALHMAAGMTEADAKKASEGIVGIFVKSQVQATGLGAAIAGTFGAMVANGATFRDALAAVQPSLDGMRTQLELTGLRGGAAFENLSRMGQIAAGEITGPLFSAVEGANQALQGLHNSGILNQEMFSGLALTATDAYNAIIAQGADGQAALQMMQPTLQTIWELQQKFGYETDAATQALIDQAIEAGNVGAAHMSAADQTAAAMNRVVDVLEAIAEFMGVTLPAAAADGAKKIDDEFSRIDPTIAEPWADWDAPPEMVIPYRWNQMGEGLPSEGAEGMVSGGVVYAASGWQARGTDIVPAMLTPGERVLTVAQNRVYEAANTSVADGLGSDAIRAMLAQVNSSMVQTGAQSEKLKAQLQAMMTTGGPGSDATKTVLAQINASLTQTATAGGLGSDAIKGMLTQSVEGWAKTSALSTQIGTAMGAVSNFKFSPLAADATEEMQRAYAVMMRQALVKFEEAKTQIEAVKAPVIAEPWVGWEPPKFEMPKVVPLSEPWDEWVPPPDWLGKIRVPDIPAPWSDWPPPPDLSGFVGGGVVHAAGGYAPQGSDTVPAMLTPGERVLSVAETSAMSRSRVETRVEEPARPGPDITININAMDPVGLKKVIEQEVGPMLVSAYRRNVNGLRTDTRKELVE